MESKDVKTLKWQEDFIQLAMHKHGMEEWTWTFIMSSSADVNGGLTHLLGSTSAHALQTIVKHCNFFTNWSYSKNFVFCCDILIKELYCK